MSSKFDHVVYALPDSGSHYPTQNLVLYPGVPVPADSINEDFRSRLFEDGHIVKCSVEKNEAGEITGYHLMKSTELPEQPEVNTDLISPKPAEVIDTAALTQAQNTPADRGELPEETGKKAK